MATNYLPYEPQQMLLLPEGHLAHFISDAIDGLDLGAFHARYDKDGPRNQPFHPAMMVKVLVYGYATGCFSSRKIARELHEDVAFRVLALKASQLFQPMGGVGAQAWNGRPRAGSRRRRDRWQRPPTRRPRQPVRHLVQLLYSKPRPVPLT